MWGTSEIDSLLNPDYEKVTDYRKLFRLIGIYIAVDNATRTKDDKGEVHLLLLVRDNRLGLLTVNDSYDESLPPMFCQPKYSSVVRFQKQLESAIDWFDTPKELFQYFKDQKHLSNPVYKKSPLIMGFFVQDVAGFLRERFEDTV